jgi:hypothetical protein
VVEHTYIIPALKRQDQKFKDSLWLMPIIPATQEAAIRRLKACPEHETLSPRKEYGRS